MSRSIAARQEGRDQNGFLVKIKFILLFAAGFVTNHIMTLLFKMGPLTPSSSSSSSSSSAALNTSTSYPIEHQSNIMKGATSQPIVSHGVSVPTIVTAYFNIESKHPHSSYLQWMENMLSLQDPMIIYTTSEMVSTFKKLRRHALGRTKIVEMELNDMRMSQYGTEFWEKQLAIDPERMTHKSFYLYWVWAEKVEFLWRAVEDNPFNSEFFAWVDMGYYRTKDYNNKRMLQRIPTKLQRNQILALDVSGISSDGVGGGFIGGYADGLMRFHALYYDILDANKDNFFIGKEQDWFEKVCRENVGLCMLVRVSQHVTS
jgi:hypothetical protein